VKNKGIEELLKKAQPDVRAAYNYTDVEVECLYDILISGVPKTMEGVRAEASLNRKLGLLEHTSVTAMSTDAGRVNNNHSTLKDFATWLFHGEAAETVAMVPSVIRCLPYPNGCGRVFQKPMFPFWPTDGRCGICIQRECHPTTGRERRDIRVSQLHKLLAAGKSKQIDDDLARFVQTFSRFVQYEGGVDGIATSWHQWFEEQRLDENKKKSATLGNAYLATMKLWLEVDKHRDQQQSFDDMTDSELESFIFQKMVGKMTREQIALLVQEADDKLGAVLSDGMDEEVYAEEKSVST